MLRIVDLSLTFGVGGLEVQHLITDCHLCVGLIPTSGNAVNLSQYNPFCLTGSKTITWTRNFAGNLMVSDSMH